TGGVIPIPPLGFAFAPPITPSVTQERLEYEENSLSVVLNQLVGKRWSFGAHYQFTGSELLDAFPDIPLSVSPAARSRFRSDLHQAGVFGLFNHPSGFFARAETIWYHQRNSGFTPPTPGD